MQGNWSLIINILLLIGVFGAIAVMVLKSANQKDNIIPDNSVDNSFSSKDHDDIISVRKIDAEHSMDSTYSTLKQDLPSPHSLSESSPNTLMLLLMAKGNNYFHGYELLQTLLALGFRFGEGCLFHRHQHVNGQGPILFSMASATREGTFDLQNISGFKVRGLCLFMQLSHNSTIDKDRFELMLESARQLSLDLDGYVLDDEHRMLEDRTLEKYYQCFEKKEELLYEA